MFEAEVLDDGDEGRWVSEPETTAEDERLISQPRIIC